MSSFTDCFKPSDHSKEWVASVKEELPLEWPLWDPIVRDSETQQGTFLTEPGSQEDRLLDSISIYFEAGSLTELGTHQFGLAVRLVSSRDASVCLSSDGITDVHHHIWVFTWVLGMILLTQQTLY